MNRNWTSYRSQVARTGAEFVRSLLGQSSPDCSPPQLSGALPLVRHMPEFARSPFKMLMRARAECGDAVEFQLLNQAIVMITGPAANEAFFRAPDDQLCRREAYRVMTPIFGKGVVFDAPAPRMNRQLGMIMPLLRDQVMRSYPPRIAEEATSLTRRWGDEGEIDILEFMKELTIYTSTRCLIGEEFRSGITEEFFSIYHDLEQGVHPLAYIMPHLPIPKFRRRDAARVRLQQLIAGLMAKRQGDPNPPKDGLQILLESTYEDGTKLSPHEMTGILTALILAGHHTSAGTAAWTLIELLRNPKFMQVVVDEIDDVLWDELQITYPLLREMTGLGAVIKEVLRLHPPLIFLFRKVLRDFEFGGYVVPAGKFVCAAPAVTHRIADVFPDPERFNPERYASETQDHPSAWISFGGGKHKCTGNAFGTLQLKTIIATLLSKYQFELVNAPADYQDDYTTATVQPKGPCRLRYRLRDRAGQRRPTRMHKKKAKISTSELRVTVDLHLCQGHAVCMSEAPEVFRVEGGSAEVLLDPQTTALRKTAQMLRFYPPTELNQQVVCAARFCPNKAITIEEAADDNVGN